MRTSGLVKSVEKLQYVTNVMANPITPITGHAWGSKITQAVQQRKRERQNCHMLVRLNSIGTSLPDATIVEAVFDPFISLRQIVGIPKL